VQDIRAKHDQVADSLCEEATALWVLAVAERDGLGERADPGGVASLGEFAVELRTLLLHSTHLTSMRDIGLKCGLSRSSVWRALGGEVVPRSGVVEALLAPCRLSPANKQLWMKAWAQVAGGHLPEVLPGKRVPKPVVEVPVEPVDLHGGAVAAVQLVAADDLPLWAARYVLTALNVPSAVSPRSGRALLTRRIDDISTEMKRSRRTAVRHVNQWIARLAEVLFTRYSDEIRRSGSGRWDGAA
jgi:hypothetical protein